MAFSDSVFILNALVFVLTILYVLWAENEFRLYMCTGVQAVFKKVFTKFQFYRLPRLKQLQINFLIDFRPFKP